jgi:hypothetical protein
MTLNLQRVFTLTQKALPLLRAAAEAGGKIGDAFKDPARIINVRYHRVALVCLLKVPCRSAQSKH